MANILACVVTVLNRMKLSTPIHKDNSLLVPNSGYAVEHIRARSSTTVLIVGVSRVKKVSSLVTCVSSCLVPYHCRSFPASISIAETFHVVDSCQKNCSSLLKDQPLTEDTRQDNLSNLAKNSNSENEREMQRRKRIGLANKGKVPWNKGRKHSEETREIISRRTKEALRDPKVRAKMSECPRSLSNQTKTRISRSLQKLWGQRLKWKRSEEKLLQLWAESIARVAKTGGSDQQELDWDSYEKMKRAIALQHLERAAQMAKEKEMAHVLAERAAKERDERKKILAQRKRELAQKAKVRKRKRSKEEREEFAANQESKLKAKLTKIHKLKPAISHFSSHHQRTWKNVDVGKLDALFTRTEQHQVSLADQIRLAKIKRAESATQDNSEINSWLQTKAEGW
ncbi:nucleoporin GLE1 isoform X1 [Coffea eugenioides]|uniref:nucleoporin GLE1 isoform X1 n=1 Tax=Coffea eugenioides TaxID=49369 RepID=UPI000F61389A|nr:nucleoporin GLE1 isoform X1 [Coffea eugenioides]